jgi:Mg2+ and Co2+ transporter CorA
MTPHEAAQSLWWFVAIVMVAIAIVLFIECRKENKDD